MKYSFTIPSRLTKSNSLRISALQFCFNLNNIICITNIKMAAKTDINDLGNGMCILCELDKAEEWCNNCAVWLCRQCRNNSHDRPDQRNHDITSLDHVMEAVRERALVQMEQVTANKKN